jgi:hypothetical protein
VPKIEYQPCAFRPGALALVAKANVIIAEYLAMGYRLTLRQLYYQFVSHDGFPDDRRWTWTGSKWVRDPNGTKNAQPNYKWMGDIINSGRLAGLIDWDAIEDRGRNLLRSRAWESPGDILEACASQFRLDLWEDQPHYVECWIEKEALIGVVAVPCEKLRVPHFACKGYTSQSEMWDAGHNRLKRQRRLGKEITILHLGDHDPSGIDMTRDIRERLSLFVGKPVEVVRLALNMDQVEQYDPPPNPAKMTDSRFEGYAERFGDESWELDALSPDTIGGLIEKEIRQRIDMDLWEEALKEEEDAKDQLAAISERFDEVVEFLQN